MPARVEAKQGPTSWDRRLKVQHLATGCKLVGKIWELPARQFGDLIVMPTLMCAVCSQTMKATVL